MLHILLTSALAEPLVHDGGADEALARARAVAAGPFEPVALDALGQAAPTLRSGGSPLGACEPGPIQADAVRGHLLYGELDAAREKLARERRRCEARPADRALLERAAGLLAATEGDAEGAAAAFVSAKAFDPTVGWDEGFAAELRAPFDAAEPAVVSLTVHPSGATVDGVPLSGPVARGVHTVQVGDVQVVVQIDDDDVLSVPAAHPATLPPLADEPARRDLSLVLAASLGEGLPVSVVAPDALWSGTTGRVDWRSTPWPTPSQPDAQADAQPLPRSKAPTVLMVVGGVLAAGGYGLAAVSSGPAHREFEAAQQATTPEDWDAASRAPNGRVWAGQIGGGVGAATALTGLVWQVSR